MIQSMCSNAWLNELLTVFKVVFLLSWGWAYVVLSNNCQMTLFDGFFDYLWNESRIMQIWQACIPTPNDRKASKWAPGEGPHKHIWGLLVCENLLHCGGLKLNGLIWSVLLKCWSLQQPVISIFLARTGCSCSSPIWFGDSAICYYVEYLEWKDQ